MYLFYSDIIVLYPQICFRVFLLYQISSFLGFQLLRYAIITVLFYCWYVFLSGLIISVVFPFIFSGFCAGVICLDLSFFLNKS